MSEGQFALEKKTITPRPSSKAMGGGKAPERVSGSTGACAIGSCVHDVESHAQVVVGHAVRSQADASCCTSITVRRTASYPSVPAAIAGCSCDCQRAPSHVQVRRLPT